MREARDLPWIATLAAVALLYFAAGRVGLVASVAPSSESYVWPAAGLALAALLLLGIRAWPGVAVGRLMLGALGPPPWPAVIAATVGTTAAAVLGAWLVGRYASRVNTVERLRDVLVLVGMGAVASTLVAATLGAGSLGLVHGTPWRELVAAWFAWWSGDALGILLVTPLLLAWLAPGARVSPSGRTLEAVVLIAIVVVAGEVLFHPLEGYEYAIFPLVGWAAIRFGVRGATAVAAIAAVQAVQHTLGGVGPFVEGAPQYGLAMLQLYLGLLALTGLILSAVTTERTAVAEALKESEREARALYGRFALLFNGVPIAALVVGRDGVIEVANPAAEKLFAVRPLEGRSIRDFAEGSEDLRDWIFTLHRTGDAINWRITRPDGALREVEWTASPMVGDEDRRAICVVEDRTEERARTAQLRTVDSAMRAMRDGVTLVDDSGVIMFANRAAAIMHGYGSPDELVGHPVSQLVPPDYTHQFSELLPTMRSEGWRGEAEGLRRDGSVFPVELTVSPISLDGGHVGTVAVITDLTERRRLEARAVTEDKLATLGRLVAGTAHEINNPLAAVLANAQLMLAEMAASSPYRAALETIDAEVRRASRIVRDMLSFARQSPVTRKSFDLRESIAQVLRFRGGYHRALGIQLQTRLPRVRALAVGDPDQVQQVLLNVLVNAEYAVRNVEKPRVTVTLGVHSGRWRVGVDDNGPGVPLERREQIFEPFYTTKPEGEGSGLGLSVSYGILREHDGRIWVEDGELGGARFVIELMADREPPDAGTVTRQEPPRYGRSAALRLQVLVVDDEEAIRAVAQRILEGRGHSVSVAPDGQAALALLDVTAFDVILCDIRMPTLSGPDLFAEVQRRGGVVPRFIIMTGDIADPQTQRFVDEAKVPVLLKPFELEALLNVVEG